ncbi:hypothetical protein DMENIID0001_105710 [Sergentomyia squamirostris]
MRCIVKNCGNTLKFCPDGVTFHRFPQNALLARKWKILVNLGIAYIPKEKDRICSMHFLPEDFEARRFKDRFKKYLRPNSCPVPIGDVDLETLEQLLEDPNDPYYGGYQQETSYGYEPTSTSQHMGFMQPMQQQSGWTDESMEDGAAMYAAQHEYIPVASSSHQYNDTPSHRRPMVSFPQGESSQAKRSRYQTKLDNMRTATITREKPPSPNTSSTLNNYQGESVAIEKVKIESLKELLFDLKENNYINEEISEILRDTVGFGEETFDDMIKMTNMNDVVSHFQSVMRDFAINFDLYAPKAYRYVIRVHKSCLPPALSFYGWYKNSECDPGFTQECLDTIVELVKNEREFGRNVICQLVYDERDIYPTVMKIGEKTYGYASMASVDTPSNDVAVRVLIFVLVDVNGGWKMPIGYFPVKYMTAEIKQNLIEKAITYGESTGAKILGVTFRGEPNNFAAMKLMGSSFDMGSPLFSIKLRGETDDDYQTEKSYFIYPDPPDMMRLVKQTFMTERKFLDGDGYIVDFKYLEDLEHIYEEACLQMDTRLKPLQGHFQRKKVNIKLAVQLLDKSVADALDYCRTNGAILRLNQFNGSEATSKFIRMISNISDVLKSHHETSSDIKSSILIGNVKRIQQFCENAQKYIFDLCLLSDSNASIDAADKEPVISSAKKTGFLGLFVCLDNLPRYFDAAKGDLKPNVGLKTNFLNQNSIDLLYNSIRSGLTSNTQPSILEFRSAYKQLITYAQIINDNTGSSIVGTESVKILRVNPTRCIQSINFVSTTNISKNMASYFKDEASYEESWKKHSFKEEEIISREEFMTLSQGQEELEAQNGELLRGTIVTVTGFLIEKLIEKIKCPDCIAVLRDAPDENLLYIFRQYSFPQLPSKFVTDICDLTDEIFRGEIQYLGINFILENTHENEMMSQVTKHFIFESDHFDLQRDHKYNMIELIGGLYLRVRIYHELSKVNTKEAMRQIYKTLTNIDSDSVE